MTSKNGIAIGDFQYHDSLWFISIPAFMLAKKLRIEQNMAGDTLANHARAILLKTHPSQPWPESGND